jgi:hypothetical protein
MIQDEQQLVAMLGGSTPQVLKSQMILIECEFSAVLRN